MSLDNANPILYERTKERDLRPEDEDDDVEDEFDDREVFGMVDDAGNRVEILFTPTIPHCSMATLIGLSIRVDVKISPGTHASEDADVIENMPCLEEDPFKATIYNIEELLLNTLALGLQLFADHLGYDIQECDLRQRGKLKCPEKKIKDRGENLVSGCKQICNAWLPLATSHSITYTKLSYLLVEEMPALIIVGLPVVFGQREQLVPVELAQTVQRISSQVTYLSLATANDPIKDADVITKTWPQELAFVVHSEPVHMEDLGHLYTSALSSESQCSRYLPKLYPRKGLMAMGSCMICLPLNSAAAVASDFTQAPTITPCSQPNDSNTSGTPADIHKQEWQTRLMEYAHSAALIAVTLKMWSRYLQINLLSDSSAAPTLWSATPEDECTDWHSLFVLPFGMDDRALACRATEAGVRVGSLPAISDLPGLAQPVGNGHTLGDQ
ncbi:GALL2-like protein [Mya arenaria]|uniref:GALL2-like protein n=1 Tax=Mya arenaria TaxID=6604 RepID=A0ABY7EST9_MYAAR|nr:GALL2-like protein [Mya arenaria]